MVIVIVGITGHAFDEGIGKHTVPGIPGKQLEIFSFQGRRRDNTIFKREIERVIAALRTERD